MKTYTQAQLDAAVEAERLLWVARLDRAVESTSRHVAEEREAIAETLQRMADAADMAGGLASPKLHRLREAAVAVRARGPKANLTSDDPRPGDNPQPTAASPSTAPEATETPAAGASPFVQQRPQLTEEAAPRPRSLQGADTLEASPFAGHTPGPWRVEGWTAPDAYGWTVQCDQKVSIDAFSAESEANAHLIAAAPSLLAERDRLRALDLSVLDAALNAGMQKTETVEAFIARLLGERDQFVEAFGTAKMHLREARAEVARLRAELTMATMSDERAELASDVRRLHERNAGLAATLRGIARDVAETPADDIAALAERALAAFGGGQS